MEGSSFQVVSPASLRNEVEITPAAFCKPRRSQRIRDRSRRIDQHHHRMPTQFGRSADGARRDRRRAIEHEHFSSGILEDVDLRIDRHIRLDGDISHDHAGGDAEPFLQSPEQIASELIVLPEHRDLAIGIGGLDVIGVNPSLGAKRRLPAHGPRKPLRMRPLLVAGRDKELRHFLLVEIGPRRQIARRAERAEHQQHVLLLDQLTCVLGCHPRIGAVVTGDEFDLATVDAAAIIDHVEIGGFGPADRRERSQRPGIGHDVADADFGIGDAAAMGLLR